MKDQGGDDYTIAVTSGDNAGIAAAGDEETEPNDVAKEVADKLTEEGMQTEDIADGAAAAAVGVVTHEGGNQRDAEDKAGRAAGSVCDAADRTPAQAGACAFEAAKNAGASSERAAVIAGIVAAEYVVNDGGTTEDASQTGHDVAHDHGASTDGAAEAGGVGAGYACVTHECATNENCAADCASTAGDTSTDLGGDTQTTIDVGGHVVDLATDEDVPPIVVGNTCLEVAKQNGATTAEAIILGGSCAGSSVTGHGGTPQEAGEAAYETGHEAGASTSEKVHLAANIEKL